MDVNGVGSTSGGLPIRKVSEAMPAQKPVEARPVSPKDELQLSSVSSPETAKAELEGAFRAQRLAQIQQQIADGTYDIPEKLEAAVDRMLERLKDE